MTAVLEPPDAIGREPAPWQPRRRALAAVAVAALVVAAWAWTGLRPSLVAGELTGVRGLERTADDAAWQVTPTGGRLVLTVRNDGSVPVTLSTSEDAAEDAARVAGFVRLDDQGQPRTTQVEPSSTVGAGEEAHAVLQAGVLPPYCRPPGGGTGTGSQVVLTARTLGLPTTQRLPLPLPVQVVAPSPACE